MSEKDYDARMHTVEHLLNGTFSKMFDCQRAFSTHIERKKSKIDIRFTRPLTDQESVTLEERVNEILALNIDVTDEYMSYERASEMFDLSRLPDNERQGDIRIVHIGQYDSCPCIGTHLNNTSECNGRLKIISSDFAPENNVLRVRFKVVNL